MAYLNKVMLIGNMGKDPEIRVTPNGSKQVKFSLATTERFKNKQSGEMQERTDWHNIVGWRFTADLVERLNLQKGTSLYIEGKLRHRSWDDPDGGKKYITEIEMDNFQILTPKNRQDFTNSAPAPNPNAKPTAAGYDPADDDMPF